MKLPADGSLGRPGDKHCQCCHGNRKVLMITRAMNHSLNGMTHSLLTPYVIIYLLKGLIGHLRTHFKPLFNFYITLKDWDSAPTDDEIAFASGSKEFTDQDQVEYCKIIETRASSLNVISLNGLLLAINLLTKLKGLNSSRWCSICIIHRQHSICQIKRAYDNV